MDDFSPEMQAALKEDKKQAANEIQYPKETPQNTTFETATKDDLAGFSPEMQKHLTDVKYGTVGQQAKAGLEGMAEGIAGPVAPIAEQALGVNPEDILARREQPIHTAGEVGGFLLPISAVGKGFKVLGTGLKALEVAGLAKAGTGAVSTAIKIGSLPLRMAIESTAMQGLDETSKLALGDPKQSIDTAVSDLKLAALFGAGVGGIGVLGAGAANKLWNASSGTKTAGILKQIVNKVGGMEDAIPDSVQTAIDKSGIELAPELKGALAKDPKFQEIFNDLRQSESTSSGKKVQEAYTNFQRQSGDAMVEAMGRTPESVEKMGELSKYEAGKEIGNTLAQEYKTQVEPIAEKFNSYRDKYGKLELPQDVRSMSGEVVSPGAMSEAADKISQLSIDQKWVTSPSSKIMTEVNRVLKELPGLKDVGDVTGYIQAIGDNTFNKLEPALTRAGSMMKGIVRDVQADVIASRVGREEGAEALQAFNDAKSQYSAQSKLKDALNDRLHIKGSNTSNFGKGLVEMASTKGEKVLNRLSGKTDANLLSFIQQNYPKTAELIKDYHISDLLRNASDKAGEGMTISSEALMKKLSGLSPELKQFIASPEALEKLQAIGELNAQFNKLPSEVASKESAWLNHLPSAAVALAVGLVSHNPYIGAAAGAITKTLGKEIPDAAKLTLLKFMGSAKPVDALGFKAAAELINHTMSGEKAMVKASSNVFKIGSAKAALPDASQKERELLDKNLKKLQQNPESLMQIGDKAAYYMPDHGIALTAFASNAAQYLNSQRPTTAAYAPLDTPVNPTPIQMAAYNNKLDIANNPLLVFDKIKNGTVTPDDIQALTAVYPALKTRMTSQLSSHMADAIAKKQTIPYKTRMGISLFTGQPMDSTMTPTAIMNAQTANLISSAHSPQQSHGSRSGRPSSPALQKISSSYRTPGQSSEFRRITHK